MTDQQFNWFKKWVEELSQRENVGTLQKLSQLLGVHPSLFQKYLNRKTVPTPKRIVQLAVVDTTTADADNVSTERLCDYASECLIKVGMTEQLTEDKILQLATAQHKRLRSLEQAEEQPSMRQQWTFDLEDFQNKDLQINVRVVAATLVVELQIKQAVEEVE